MPAGRFTPAYDAALYDEFGNLIDPNAVPPPPAETAPVQTGPAGQAAAVATAVSPPEVAAAGSTAYDTPMPLEDGGYYVPPPAAGPPPQPAYLPESSAYQPAPAVTAPVPPPAATPSAPSLGGYYAAGGAPIGGAAVPPQVTYTDYSSGQPVAVYDPSIGGLAPNRQDPAYFRTTPASEAERTLRQRQSLESAMMLGGDSPGVTTQDILTWRPPGNTLAAGEPVSTDAGFIWGPPLWSGSPSVARTVPRRQYTPGPRGEVPAPEPIVSSRRVPPPENLPISEPPGSTGVPRTEPYRQPTGSLLVDRFGNPFRPAETIVPPPEPSAGQPYVRQTRGDPRFGPGEVIPPPPETVPVGRPALGRAGAEISARGTPRSRQTGGAAPGPEPVGIIEAPPRTGRTAEVDAAYRQLAAMQRAAVSGLGIVHQAGRVLGRASLTAPGQAAARGGGVAGGITRKLLTPKTVIPALVAGGLLMQANWQREYGKRGAGTTPPAETGGPPVPTPDETQPQDLPEGATDEPRQSGMIYIRDADGEYIGVRDADGTPVYFPEGATDADKDAIVADVQSRLSASATVEPPAGGNVPVEPIAPLATGAAAAGEAGGTPNAGTPLLTPDGTDTGLTLASDGSVNTGRGSSGGDGYRGGGSSRGGYRSGGSSYRGGGSRRRKDKKRRGGFGSNGDLWPGFPFQRPPSPLREQILAAIAESLAKGRNSRS